MALKMANSIRWPKIEFLHSTLEFQINVLDQISVLVGKNVKFNKRTGPNKCTGGKVKKVFSTKCPINQYEILLFISIRTCHRWTKLCITQKE